MISPAMIGLIAFVVVPFGTAIWLSLNNVQMNSLRPPEWFGLEQYRRILLDPLIRGDFYSALRNNMVFAAVVVPLQTGLAIGLALLLNRPLRGMAIFRTFFFMPVVFPMALVTVIWSIIYDHNTTGVLNSLMSAVSFDHLGAQDWLGSSTTSLAAIIVMSIWQGVGFQMVIVLAGLQGIPAELYEAASMDGAGWWRQLAHITIPGLRNTLIFVVMVTSIFSFRLFDQVYILIDRGAPRSATETLMYLSVSNAFDNVSRGAAVSVIFVVIVLLLTLLQRLLLREEREIS